MECIGTLQEPRPALPCLKPLRLAFHSSLGFDPRRSPFAVSDLPRGGLVQLQVPRYHNVILDTLRPRPLQPLPNDNNLTFALQWMSYVALESIPFALLHASFALVIVTKPPPQAIPREGLALPEMEQDHCLSRGLRVKHTFVESCNSCGFAVNWRILCL